MRIGDKIRELRQKSRTSQKDLAISVGISQNYMCLIEAGTRTPSNEVMQKFADHFSIPLPILVWQCVDESEVQEHKKELFKRLKPAIDGMINSIFNENE